jgi:hypothetical protein
MAFTVDGYRPSSAGGGVNALLAAAPGLPARVLLDVRGADKGGTAVQAVGDQKGAVLGGGVGGDLGLADGLRVGGHAPMPMPLV